MRDPDIFDKIIESNRETREMQQKLPNTKEDPYQYYPLTSKTQTE